jgi:ABC-type Na+ efflux pump permease subunit
MRRTLLIAWRDYIATVKTKSFVIGIFLIPVLLVGGGGLIATLSAVMLITGDNSDKHFAVIDRTPGKKVLGAMQEAAERRNKLLDRSFGRRLRPAFVLEAVEPCADNPEAIQEQRFEVSDRVQRREIFGFVEIGPDVLTPPKGQEPQHIAMSPMAGPLVNNLSNRVLAPARDGERSYLRYQTDGITYQEFPMWADEVLNRAILKERLLQAGMNADKLPSLEPVVFRTEGLTRRDDQTGTLHDQPVTDQLAGYLLPLGIVFLMFMGVMIGTGPAMQSVVEEKMQRISEVLLGSVRPFELMMGKLLGRTAVSLTMSIVYLGAAILGTSFTRMSGATQSGWLDFIPAPVLIWFLPYQVLALMMYGSLSLGIGAAAKDLRGTEPYIFPVAMLATLPMFFLVPIMQHPNSGFSTALSFFPFASPMLMTARLAVPPGVPWWQPVAALVPMVLTTLACVYAAGRVFRVGILMQGKGAGLGDLMRWVVRG